MSEPVKRAGKRRYVAPRRQQQAQATRARLLATARRLFAEQGYAATSMAAIARQAGVAVETLYLHFGSKPAMLQAVVASVADDEGLRPFVERVMTKPDPAAKLAHVAALARHIYERSWDVVEILRGAGTADASARSAWLEADARARVMQEPMVASLAAAGALASGLDSKQAADVLWALSGPDVYRLLVVDSGWTPEQYEHWLGRSLRALLLGG